MIGCMLFTALLLVYGVLLSSGMWLPFVSNKRWRNKIGKVLGSDDTRLVASWIAIVFGVWNLFAPDFGAMNSPTIVGALIPSTILVIDGLIICPEFVRVIRIPKRIQNKWIRRILNLEKAAGPVTVLAAILHALFYRSLFF